MLLWIKAPHRLFATARSRDGSTGNLMRNHIAIRILVTALLCCLTTAQVSAYDMAAGGPLDTSDRLCSAWVRRMLEGDLQKKNNKHQCGLTGPLFTGTQWTPRTARNYTNCAWLTSVKSMAGNPLTKIEKCVACRGRAADLKAALETDRQWKCGLSGKVNEYASSSDPAQKLYEFCVSSSARVLILCGAWFPDRRGGLQARKTKNAANRRFRTSPGQPATQEYRRGEAGPAQARRPVSEGAVRAGPEAVQAGVGRKQQLGHRSSERRRNAAHSIRWWSTQRWLSA